MIIMINSLGLLLIIAVVYWFWLSQPAAKRAQGEVSVIVAEGVYQPSVIEIPAQQALVLNFLRKDATACAEIVQFKDLDISAVLPLNKSYTLNLPPLAPGVYEFMCQMGMYRGKLMVQ